MPKHTVLTVAAAAAAAAIVARHTGRHVPSFLVDASAAASAPYYHPITSSRLRHKTTSKIKGQQTHQRQRILQEQKEASEDLLLSTHSPSPSPDIIIGGGGGSSYHSGPHLFDHDADDELFSNNNDDPPYDRSGGGGGGDRTNNSYYNTRQDETDFKEFIAFVGWYAFLIFCCLLPTVCAYYRRRRNARVLRENFLNIQSRLAEIERRRMNEHLDGVGAGVGAGGGGVVDLNGDNRDQDWEFLEQLFGPIRGTNNENTEDASANRRRIVMGDILGGVSMRMLVERERLRRRERGRRLVAALKDTSISVKECHLIPNNEDGSVSQPQQQQQQKFAGGLDDNNNIGGDIEMGGMTESNTDNETNMDIGSEGEGNEDTAATTLKQSGLIIGPGDESNNSEPSEQDQETNDDAPVKSTSTTAEDGDKIPSKTDPPAAASPAEEPTITLPNTSDVDSPFSIDGAVPTVVPPPQNNLTSLYAVDDPYVDDDDNKYSAICLPCTTDTVGTTTTTINSTGGETTRLVSATCAICLVHYEPGCYVSWSPNKECTHAFHRDCILMWLLKKEEPLCPCCRREFVLASTLNEDGDDGNDTAGGGGEGDGNNNDDGGGEATSASDAQGVTQTSNQLPQALPAIRFSNFPGSFTVLDISGMSSGGGRAR